MNARHPLRTAFLALPVLCLLGACSTPDSAQPHPSCRVVESISGTVPGPEDFDVLYNAAGHAEMLIVSANDRRAGTNISERNGIYSIDLDQTGRPALAKRLSAPDCRDGARHYAAKPHGISLVQRVGDRFPTLYVINHAPDCPGSSPPPNAGPDVVEVYTLRSEGLIPQPDLPRNGELLRNPNDLVGLPDGTVFLTNISHHRSRALTPLDLLVPSGSVVRYRSGSWSSFDRGYSGSNGIAFVASNDPGQSDLLHVAEFHGRKIHTLSIDADRALAARISTIETPHKPDNLLVDRSDPALIWIGSHPSMLRIVRHMISPEQNAQTDITSFSARSPTQASVRQRYFFEGPMPNGGATAIEIGEWLYVGQVFDSGLVACGPW